MTPYQQTIREDLASLGLIGANPAHVEACMRQEHPTLDHLSPAQFRAAVKAGAEYAREAGEAMCAKLAWMEGCGPKPEVAR